MTIRYVNCNNAIDVHKLDFFLVAMSFYFIQIVQVDEILFLKETLEFRIFVNFYAQLSAQSPGWRTTSLA